MAKLIAAVICVALFGLVASPMDAVAQQKTAKACREEWRANRTANQADGISERAYVARCRSGNATRSIRWCFSTPCGSRSATIRGEEPGGWSGARSSALLNSRD